jgi:uncharacterized protein (DUF885 family)
MTFGIDVLRRHGLNAFLVLLCTGLTACSQKPDEPEFETRPALQPEAVASESQPGLQQQSTAALRTLADDVWARSLEISTYLRLIEGLPIEKFEDLTLEQFHENQAVAEQFRTRLEQIDASALSGDDLITYEILEFQLKDDGANDDDFWLMFDVTAYIGPYHFQYAKQALAALEIQNQAGADHYLFLVGELADMIDQLVIKIEGQIERGIYLPKPALPPVRETWQGLKSAMPAGLRVADERLASLSGKEREAFSSSLASLIETRVIQGFDRLLAAIGPAYEANAPEQVGLSQYPGGRELYERRVGRETTLALTPEEIHERGKKAVRDISARMEALRVQLEFEGTAQDFYETIKSDPRFIAGSAEEVGDRFMQYIRRIEPKLDGYFKYRPRADYGVRRLPLASEAGMTYGYYNPPTVAEPVGYYNYNASNLPERNMIWAGSLIYHELLPGHHFHMATQSENEALQEFRKKYSVAAFTEGWAEYAGSLAIEMGMYETAWELYGRYIAEMFLASRLVVDTGMNALGWSLEDARVYMREYVIQSDAEIASETLRYSTSIPAQALAYRLGYEKQWELRKRAEAELGDNFDIREYHNVVLSDGAKPLGVLESRVQRYIQENKQQ